MHHQEIDPSLRAAEPAPETLADGFSPPADVPVAEAQEDPGGEPGGAALPPKSPF